MGSPTPDTTKALPRVEASAKGCRQSPPSRTFLPFYLSGFGISGKRIFVPIFDALLGVEASDIIVSERGVEE
jgi:hypothetical protein